MVCYDYLFSGTNLVNICISCIAQHKFRNRCKNISAFCRNLKSNTEKMLGNITKHNFVWRLLIYVRYYFILKFFFLKIIKMLAQLTSNKYFKDAFLSLFSMFLTYKKSRKYIARNKKMYMYLCLY